MKKLIVFLALLTLSVSLLGCHKNRDFRNGDIILHTSKSNQSKMIQEITGSKYSHVGIIYIKDGKTYVMEAVQPIKLTPIDEFIKRGVNSKYTVLRYTEKLSDNQMNRMYNYASKQLGKRYDLKFQWSDESMYCSELIFKIYDNAGIVLCDINKFKDYDLSSSNTQKMIKSRYNTDINLNERVVTPVDLYNSYSTRVIFDNY